MIYRRYVTFTQIIDADTGKILGPNQDGEICVRGPTVMKGEATKTLSYKSSKLVFRVDVSDISWYAY